VSLPPLAYAVGKSAICHSTGSAANPFNLIVVDTSETKTHLQHGDALANALGQCPDAAVARVGDSRQVAKQLEEDTPGGQRVKDKTRLKNGKD
jgi:hypothetical protein